MQSLPALWAELHAAKIFFEPGMVIAWLKRILEILNNTIAAAEAARGKDFLPALRFAYYRIELFAIREEVLELIKDLRSR